MLIIISLITCLNNPKLYGFSSSAVLIYLSYNSSFVITFSFQWASLSFPATPFSLPLALVEFSLFVAQQRLGAPHIIFFSFFDLLVTLSFSLSRSLSWPSSPQAVTVARSSSNHSQSCVYISH